MKMSNIKYPPIEYLFFDFQQPTPDAWEAVNAFASPWNMDHKSQFVKGETGEWGVILKEGILDEEYALLREAVDQLKSKYNVVFFLGAVDTRKLPDFEQAPYVQIVGNTYPSGFVVNEKEAIGNPGRCSHCKRIDPQSGPILETLIIDESFLEAQVDPSADYTPPGLDLINLQNGALLVSKKIVQLLESMKVQGYELIPVASKATNEASKRIFLIRANKAILKPCKIHTPTTEEGICPVCGRILGGVLGDYYVREEWLGSDQVFSRHPLKYASIYISNELYHAMKAVGAKGLLPAFGIYKCNHALDQ
jgi:hypothetical protein